MLKKQQVYSRKQEARNWSRMRG